MTHFIRNTQVKAMTSIWMAKQKARELAGRTGALILAGLYLIVDSTVLPTITQRIKDMFDYAG